MVQQYPSRQIDSEKEKYFNKLFPATVNKRKWKEKQFRKIQFSRRMLLESFAVILDLEEFVQ
jgi:hypothetical protein